MVVWCTQNTPYLSGYSKARCKRLQTRIENHILQERRDVITFYGLLFLQRVKKKKKKKKTRRIKEKENQPLVFLSEKSLERKEDAN